MVCGRVTSRFQLYDGFWFLREVICRASVEKVEIGVFGFNSENENLDNVHKDCQLAAVR
jgi:hypothetical protein